MTATTTYSVALGFDGSMIATVTAPTPEQAARSAHVELCRQNKESAEGWTAIEHGPGWGTSAARQNGSGNGSQNVDGCLFVYRGAYDDDHIFDVTDRDAADLVSIVEMIAPREF